MAGEPLVVSLADNIGGKPGANRSGSAQYPRADEAIDVKSDEEASRKKKHHEGDRQVRQYHRPPGHAAGST